MTYTNTYTPRVLMPRSDARVTAMPKTEQEYARLLDALCRKEGKRGAVPDSPQNLAKNLDEKRLTKIMSVLKKKPMKTSDLATKTKFSISSVQSALSIGKKQGKLNYNHKTKEWELK